MNNNSNAILTLCSHLCVAEGVEPLQPKEYSELVTRLRNASLMPSNILTLSKTDFKELLFCDEQYYERVARLIDRNASLCFELEKLEHNGIYTITRADSAYPAMLKRKLGNSCPPFFYYAGNLSLFTHKFVGYVGSRTISDADITFTCDAVKKTVEKGYGVVSGGAKGVDSTASERALNLTAPVIEFLSDSMIKKLRNNFFVNSILQGHLLFLSVVKPDAPFNAGVAMMRNRYIYAQSMGTVVVKAEYNKGGTWNGAIDNLKKNHQWCPLFCRNEPKYQGNMELIKAGAIPINDNWDGDVTSCSTPISSENTEQISFII